MAGAGSGVVSLQCKAGSAPHEGWGHVVWMSFEVHGHSQECLAIQGVADQMIGSNQPADNGA